jgi:hypothetical protein
MALVALVAVPAGAAEFYATNNLSTANFGTTGDELIIYDFATAGWVSVGDTGLGGLGGLDWSSTARTTLIVADSFGASPGAIYSLNPSDASSALLGFAPTPMHDLALNRENGKMYGTDSAGQLWRDDNADSIPETNLGAYAPGGFLEVGLGFDGAGNVYVLDLLTDTIYKGVGDAPGTTVPLVAVPFDSNFSQGLYVGDQMGYHGAFNGSAFASENWSFPLDGSSYVMDSVFPTWAPNGLPEVEVGDLTMVPEPATAVLLVIGSLLLATRRR